MRLSDILYKASIQSVIGDIRNIDVNKLEFDSRKITKNDLFIAIKGSLVDGHDYIQHAINNGAKSIVLEHLPSEIRDDICYVTVEDSSYCMSIMAQNYYDSPSDKIKVIGVTGTNGKTTIVSLLYKLFSELGYPTGMLSTIENRVGTRLIQSTHTTGDTLQINGMLSAMVDAGCEYCFMEVSSHAIHQNRVANINFTGGVFSNISHEHLDYHKDFQEYISIKKKFFDDLSPSSFSITNKDDKNGLVMISATKSNKITYSLMSMADYRCKVLENRFDGMLLNIHGNEVWVKLIGEFNAYNLLAIYSTSLELGVNKDTVLKKLSELDSAEGRFQTVTNNDNITGIIDYAHTPDAYKNILSTINNIRQNTERLIMVFGCGGNRDKDKRSKMTSIAADMTDQIILTTDNPREENIDDIIQDMMKDLDPIQAKKVLIIKDREEAIKTAAVMAVPGDIILLAGKGHEKYQDINGVRLPFDDTRQLKESLNIKMN